MPATWPAGVRLAGREERGPLQRRGVEERGEREGEESGEREGSFMVMNGRLASRV